MADSSSDTSKLIFDHGKSNREGEMPSFAIPWTSVDDLNAAGVVLHSGHVSPPSCKIRVLLNYYKVKYTIIQGKKNDSEYKKVPVICIGDKQINDSFIIIRVLSPILQGQEMTEEEVGIEKMTTSELMLAMEADVMDNCVELCKCGKQLGCCPGSLLMMLAPCICCCASKKIRAAHPNLQSVQSYASKYNNILKTKGTPFFHGQEAGVVDIALFGLFEPFRNAGNEIFDVVMMQTELFQWHKRLAASVPSIF